MKILKNKTAYRKIWDQIRNTICRLLFKRTAKKLVWVADDLSPQKSGYDQLATGHLASRDDHAPVDPSATPLADTIPHVSSGGIGDDMTLKTHQDIDFTRQDKLEEYLEEVAVSKETIQSWISAGILSPHEVRIAEKLIKIMRENDRDQHRNN